MRKIVITFVSIILCLPLTYCKAQNQDYLTIPSLRIKNRRGAAKEITRLIKENTIKQNDVIFVSFLTIDDENCMYVFFIDQFAAPAFKLNTLLMSEYRLQPLKGYTIILNHDCFIFGQDANMYIKETGTLKLPDRYLFINALKDLDINDYYEKMKDFHIESYGYVYKLNNNHFVKIPNI
jgi:hypothetical protein